MSPMNSQSPAQLAPPGSSLVDSSRSGSSVASDQVVKAARAPLGTGVAPLFGQLVALGLIAFGVIGIQEALVRAEIVDAASWMDRLTRFFDDRSAPAWFLPVGVVVALAGLMLLPVVFKRRPRKTLGLTAGTGVYLKSTDLSRIVAGHLDGLDGVIDSHTRSSTRRLTIEVTTIADKQANKSIEDEVARRVRPTLDALTRPPRMKIRIKNEDFA